MNGGKAQRIELGFDIASAALFAAAIAFAAARLVSPAMSAGGAALGFLASFAVLRRVTALDPDFALPEFAIASIEPFGDDELLLTDADRLAPSDELLLTDADRLTLESELVLDDVLVELETDSRVVRLFDPAAMPTPGQLQQRIDRHLGQRDSAPPDASQALHEALAELRRSLR